MNRMMKQVPALGMALAITLSSMACSLIPFVSAHTGHAHAESTSIDHVDHAHALSLAIMPVLVTGLISAMSFFAVYFVTATSIGHEPRFEYVRRVNESPPQPFRRITAPSSPRSPPL